MHIAKLRACSWLIPRREVGTAVWGINDAGGIVGFGTSGGNNRAFLLTIPEPSAALPAAPGFSGWFRRRR